MSDWIEVGDKAPAFSLTADDGSKVKLADFKGRPVVVYFYPKDDTPGCTKEACAFRDALPTFEKLDAVVMGISPDDVESHVTFKKKFDLNFTLLSDPNHKVAEKYGAWRERNRYGKKFMGIQRSTFVIDGNGVVQKTWKAVRVDGHEAKVREAIEELKN